MCWGNPRVRFCLNEDHLLKGSCYGGRQRLRGAAERALCSDCDVRPSQMQIVVGAQLDSRRS